ncbi:MAG TPA: SDR family oxidoreductase [Chloroflexota bacterium]|nr:SDR family oxidoreductase [Chloroflexota bacterium]HUM67794.1 SDR family oxidoreductase [Chloroflexota bacterium]
MKLLILGGQGMLGHKAFQLLSMHLETYAAFAQTNGPWTRFPMYQDLTRTVTGVDARQFDSVVEAFAHVRPHVVINCVGIIKQLETAKDPIASLEVNALFPHRLARLCQATRTRLIHISTDCVFSGQKGNYTEEDVPDPVDLYGRTKLLGEVNQPGCLTLRTSIIGRDFVKKVGLLEWFLSKRGQTINGFTHAIYSGLTTQALSIILYELIIHHPDLAGLYQVASQPISKYELLLKIRDALQLDIEVNPSSDFFCDRSLDATLFTQTTSIPIPSWDEMIDTLVADPTPYDTWSKME